MTVTPHDVADGRRVADALAAAFSATVVGQHALRESLLIGLLAGGHVLLESVPGLAKTTAARVVAAAVGGTFHRIQCTPDLLPGDILGTQVYDAATASFVTRLGPVHANVVLLDEINRSSAKTQSAMLEAMEERQTTIAGVAHPIGEPFLVIATQNPVDSEGTYPLSEAQTDRFLLKETVPYPSAEEEVEIVERSDAAASTPRAATPVVGLDDVRRVQRLAAAVHLDREVTRYAGRLVGVTRTPEEVLPARTARLLRHGASPRATLALCRSARAVALLDGRAHVRPEDVAAVAHRVLRHRLVLGWEAAGAGLTPDGVVDAVLRAVRVP